MINSQLDQGKININSELLIRGGSMINTVDPPDQHSTVLIVDHLLLLIVDPLC